MIVRGMNVGKMIHQEECENMEKQAKEKEPSETSKKELVGGEESQWRRTENPGDKRDKKES